MQNQDQDQHGYAILRIKRKRNEEPLDALVVDARQRRKKSRGALNVFQFAETVEEGAWDDADKTRDLQTRVSSLARGGLQKRKRAPESAPMSVSAPPGGVKSAPTANVKDPSRRYTIVQSGLPTSASEPGLHRRAPTAPPKVWSKRELEEMKRVQSGFRMYDVVPSSTTAASLRSGALDAAQDVDQEMAKFLPMLQDYLKLTEGSSHSASPSVPDMPPSASGHLAIDDDGDYVWDVFYQRPTTFQDLYGSSTSIGGNIGTLTGLPPELEAYDSDSDSEHEDEDDEDSNAEDWYKNDYPEEEDEQRSDDSGGSDEYHERSDYEDASWTGEGDRQWR
ncbi:hypothetical protein BKA93DRAFT_751605 [Sparassis latifolia]|uniref:Probable RNA polymerase II nuclear localization protein SLC7A6OS n=1 Tax=Sparassis crispa TaxID=139825 RepID=A0A401GSL2_9APHY|nr:hypothetical protein SCP_0704080 [Sparassis crispa]GBE85222.1 hypothetical protein SCP_0704080 [Sparassis crispa]